MNTNSKKPILRNFLASVGFVALIIGVTFMVNASLAEADSSRSSGTRLEQVDAQIQSRMNELERLFALRKELAGESKYQDKYNQYRKNDDRSREERYDKDSYNQSYRNDTDEKWWYDATYDRISDAELREERESWWDSDGY